MHTIRATVDCPDSKEGAPHMGEDSIPVQTKSRPVRHITIDGARPYAELRSDYERAVPHFDRLEAIGVVLSGAGWPAIEGLSRATASNGFVNFFAFDPSPVMRLNGNEGNATTYLAGNIVAAEPGFRADPSCFLYIPLRIVISEGAGGVGRLSFDHPNDLFGVFDAQARSVGEHFTSALGELLDHLGLPVPAELSGG
jgi:uncharacterized protein (DUF302 family)